MTTTESDANPREASAMPALEVRGVRKTFEAELAPAVSYTHLDVYKRQRRGSRMTSPRAVRPRAPGSAAATCRARVPPTDRSRRAGRARTASRASRFDRWRHRREVHGRDPNGDGSRGSIRGTARHSSTSSCDESQFRRRAEVTALHRRGRSLRMTCDLHNEGTPRPGRVWNLEPRGM